MVRAAFTENCFILKPDYAGVYTRQRRVCAKTLCQERARNMRGTEGWLVTSMNQTSSCAVECLFLYRL